MVKYINEIIRTNYKCNIWCKFCNVKFTNNYWKDDINESKVIDEILHLGKKYKEQQLKYITLSFSWWEPLLNKNIEKYIKLAKKIGIWTVEVQTNWIILFNNKYKLNKLLKAWLDELFIAQHCQYSKINKELWTYLDTKKLKERVKYVKDNELNVTSENKEWISIYLNIVLTKINLPYVLDFLKYLRKIWFIDLIEERHHLDNKWDAEKITRKISMWFVQPNGFAWEHRDELLLSFDNRQQKFIWKIISFCEKNNLLPDIHFVWPPLCLLFYPEYNLEYQRLKKLEEDKKKEMVDSENLESFKSLWKEKEKLEECKNCNYNKYCSWMYKWWLKYFWKDYAKKRIQKFLL